MFKKKIVTGCFLSGPNGMKDDYRCSVLSSTSDERGHVLELVSFKGLGASDSSAQYITEIFGCHSHTPLSEYPVLEILRDLICSRTIFALKAEARSSSKCNDERELFLLCNGRYPSKLLRALFGSKRLEIVAMEAVHLDVIIKG